MMTEVSFLWVNYHFKHMVFLDFQLVIFSLLIAFIKQYFLVLEQTPFMNE